MNRIDKKFLELNGEKALITFITAGDPDLETTEKLVLSMFEAGADVVELGVPFSDPVAEGITIQNASKRALDNGATLKKIFELVKKLREKTDKPLLLMMYLNSIYGFGTERFFKCCKENGIDGVIVPDMPFEEKNEVQPYAKDNDVYSISLVTPTSKDRIKKIAEEAEGFLYCVSSTGVTGVRSEFSTDFDEFMGIIKEHAKIPCAIGFGISNSEQAKTMSDYSDGVIVGSSIVKIVEKEKQNSINSVSEFVKKLKNAIL